MPDESNVLERIAQSNRMPVLFIGSGLSRRYLYRFPDWENLLKSSFKKVNDDPYFYQQHVDSLKRKGLNQFQINKALGTIIEDEFNKAFYERKIKIGRDNPNWTDSGVSPYKMYLALKFKKMDMYKTPWSYNEIEEFKKLKNKIAAVITTNYDQFLEQMIFDDDYQVYKRQYEMFSADSYNIAEIYKIHGCVSDAETIVITENDYNNFENSRKLFIAKMLTLFTDSPIIFLGYSFTDENIQKIIIDFLGCLSQRDKENIHEHLVFISWKKGERSLVEVRNNITTNDGFVIPITEIQTDNYLKVYQTLNKVIPGISASRIRETRRIVKRIVDQSIEQGQEAALIVGINDLDQISSHKALAIAVGYKEDFISKHGYSTFSDDIIFEDILKNNHNLDSRSVCFERYRSISHQRVLPIFKYAALIAEEVNKNERLLEYINSKNSKDKIISRTIQKQIKNYPQVFSFSDFEKNIDKYETLSKKCMFILKNIDLFTTESLRKTLIDLYEEYQLTSNCTHYKRCVLYLDFLENYEIYKEKSSTTHS